MASATFALIPMLVIFIIIIFIPILVGVYVYRDATQRGMNAAVWTLITILTPILIGFIIYLLVRGSYPDLKCPNCSTPVAEQYVVCPKCSVRLRAICSNCRFPIDSDWTVCPKCAVPLNAQNENYMVPVRKKDTGLGKILLVVILIPILLLVLLGVVSFVTFSNVRHSSTSAIEMADNVYAVPESTAMPAVEVFESIGTSQLTKKDYEEQPKTISWINECDKDTLKTYALCYQTERGGQMASYYLIYRPIETRNDAVSANIDTGFSMPAIAANFYDSPDSSADEKLTCIAYYSYEYVGLRVFVDGIEIECQITEVDYNPTNMH